MGILSCTFKARDKTENRTAGSSYTFYMGGSTSSKNGTERTAMQMTAVYDGSQICAQMNVLRIPFVRRSDKSSWCFDLPV